MDTKTKKDLLLSVENIEQLRSREESEEASDGGGTGRSDTNDVVRTF